MSFTHFWRIIFFCGMTFFCQVFLSWKSGTANLFAFWMYEVISFWLFIKALQKLCKRFLMPCCCILQDFCTAGLAVSGPLCTFDFQIMFFFNEFYLEVFWSAPPSEPPWAPQRTTWAGWTSLTQTCPGNLLPQFDSPRQTLQSPFGPAQPCLGTWKTSWIGQFIWLLKHLALLFQKKLKITFFAAWLRVASDRGCRRVECTWTKFTSLALLSYFLHTWDA